MDSFRGLITAFVIALVVIMGGTVIGVLADSTGSGSGGDDITFQAAEFSSNGEYVQLNDGKASEGTVFKTTGHAVNLTGADDSYIQSDGGVDVATSDTWTISVWAYVDSEAENQDMIAASVDGRAVISYNGTVDQWEGWYYDDGSRNSYEVNISTSGNEAGNYTNLMLWHNNGNMVLYRDNTSSNIVSTTGDSTISAPVASTNWNGRLEELRTFDKSLTNSERNTIVNTPVEQMPGSFPTSRAMFDQPAEDSQLLLYTDTRLETSNVTYSSGFDRQIMDGPGAIVGSDYEWEEIGPSIATIDGGELDNAPVAYVNYTLTSRGVSDMVDGWTSFAQLAEVIVVVIGVVVIVAFVGRLKM